MKKRNALLRAISFVFIPFITVSVVLTIALVIFMGVNNASGGNTLTIALVMLLTIVVLSILFSICDVIRRKYMTENPVNKILSATEKIASGDFKVRLTPTHTYDKFNKYDLIMNNVNLLAKELEKNRLVNSDFISSVSHEIKTPLSIIKSYSALLKTETDEVKRQNYIEKIVFASNRLNVLVSDILKLNKLENQQLNTDKERFNLTEQLSNCILAFEDNIAEKNIELNCDIDDVYISSSPSLLEIVWNNLLSNAVKFCSNDGTISISLKKADSGCSVSVSDTGEGFSEEVGKRLFEKFYQGDSSRSQLGNGLGLALVKRVIDLLGGTIEVESTLGVGSTFTVHIKDLK